MKYDTRIENLTVGQYQDLYKIHTSQDDDIDKAIASVSILTGLPRWDVEELPMPEFTAMSREISVLFSNPVVKEKVVKSVKVNGKKYSVILDPKKLCAGQYIDLQHFLKQNMVENIHKLMACIIVPAKRWPWDDKPKYDGENHEKIAEGIQNLSYIEIYSTCLFFSKLWNSSIKAIGTYLIREMNKEMKRKNQNPIVTEMDLWNYLAGSTMLSR